MARATAASSGMGGGDRASGQRPQRERPIDPNSPFAKLAALKEQLESSAKEKL